MTKVHLTYFKEGGKYYSEGDYESEWKYPWAIFSEVRRMEVHPNLVTKWDGYILVQPENAPSALIDLCELKSKMMRDEQFIELYKSIADLINFCWDERGWIGTENIRKSGQFLSLMGKVRDCITLLIQTNRG